MRRIISSLTLGLAVAGLTACGSSSKSTTHPAPAPAAAPAASSSVPVTSATFRAVLLHDLRYGPDHIPLAAAQKAVDCGIKKFLAQGIKTYADFSNPRNAQIEHQDGVQCARQTGFRK
jgi:hypothetical protein